jgi:predicted metal-binding membrane protein
MASTQVSRLIPAAAGMGLILAGAYQLSPLKQTCLRHCRSPLMWLGESWRPGLAGAVRLGIHHGAFCTACCWALMLIQFILGMMNLGVTLAIGAAIGIEKLWRFGPLVAKLFGAAAVIGGAYLLISALRT